MENERRLRIGVIQHLEVRKMRKSHKRKSRKTGQRGRVISGRVTS